MIFAQLGCDKSPLKVSLHKSKPTYTGVVTTMVQEHISSSVPLERLSSGPVSGLGDVRSLLPTTLLQQRHRAWALGLPPQCEVPQSAHATPLIIAVGGGKGGVGKSFIAANLAARLARLGFRVAALDLDCGGSNLHTYFGLTQIQHGLGDFIVHQRCAMNDILQPTPIEGLSIAASQRDDSWSVADSLNADGMGRFFAGVQSLATLSDKNKFDIVVIDLGAGSARHTIDMFSCAHVGVVTALPEPTSVENSYLFLRTTLMRLLSNAGHRLNVEAQAQEVLQVLNRDAVGVPHRSYTDKLRTLYQANPAVIAPLAAVLSGRMIGVVINQTRSQADIDIGRAMEMAAQRYFGFTSQYLGYLNYDESAWKSLRNKRLLLVDFPQALLTRRVCEVGSSLLKGVGITIG